jgi:hypothetical protein
MPFMSELLNATRFSFVGTEIWITPPCYTAADIWIHCLTGGVLSGEEIDKARLVEGILQQILLFSNFGFLEIPLEEPAVH